MTCWIFYIDCIKFPAENQ